MNDCKGNLLDMFDEGAFDVIIHGCNCHKNMGGGIAYQIAQRYEKVHLADDATTMGDEGKLGTIDPVLMSGWWTKFFPFIFQRRYIVNAYTQYLPGADANLKAIYHTFANFALDAEAKGWKNAKIGIPAIGCGIGGLTWPEVEEVIHATCSHLDITLVVYE